MFLISLLLTVDDQLFHQMFQFVFFELKGKIPSFADYLVKWINHTREISTFPKTGSKCVGISATLL